MRNWEFTGETKIQYGVTLRRIRAAVDFTLKCGFEITKGEIGGWIEKESNLSGNAWVSGNVWVCGNAWVSGDARVSGDAWVFGNARVSGNAWVSGNALVSGDALVSGNAWVSGNARVYCDARVYGDAWVSGDAQVCGNAWVFSNEHLLTIGKIGSRSDTTTFFRDKAGTIFVVCGCFHGTLDEFRKKVKLTHGDNKHGKVYALAADLAEAQIDTTPIEEEEDENAAEQVFDGGRSY